MKSIFLKVMSILCIISGAVGLFLDLTRIAHYIGSGMGIYGFLELFGAIFTLLAGIMGVMYYPNKSKAIICVLLGIIVIVIEVITAAVYNMSLTGQINNQLWASLGASWFNVAAELPVVPILYLIATVLFMRKKYD